MSTNDDSLPTRVLAVLKNPDNKPLFIGIGTAITLGAAYLLYRSLRKEQTEPVHQETPTEKSLRNSSESRTPTAQPTEKKSKPSRVPTSLSVTGEESVLLSLLSSYFNLGISFSVAKGEVVLKDGEVTVKGELEIARYLDETFELSRGGGDEETVGKWIEFAKELGEYPDKFDHMLDELAWYLKYRTFMVGYHVSLVDFVLFSVLVRLNNWVGVLKSN